MTSDRDPKTGFATGGVFRPDQYIVGETPSEQFTVGRAIGSVYLIGDHPVIELPSGPMALDQGYIIDDYGELIRRLPPMAIQHDQSPQGILRASADSARREADRLDRVAGELHRDADEQQSRARILRTQAQQYDAAADQLAGKSRIG